MIAPTDPDYKSTKLIKKGKATMGVDFLPLAIWIDTTYAVKTINIIYDTIDNGLRPRLNIIFEYQYEEAKFKTPYGYDETKQLEIANKFKENLAVSKTPTQKNFWRNLFEKRNSKYKAENIWIIFSAFEPVALLEAKWGILESETNKFQAELNIPEIWKIYLDMFRDPSVFFYTDAQLKKYDTPDTRELITEKYFNLIKSLDEFGYVKKEKISIIMESKETFDTEYNGNWFSYTRR
jgi:hypothetical protein